MCKLWHSDDTPSSHTLDLFLLRTYRIAEVRLKKWKPILNGCLENYAFIKIMCGVRILRTSGH
jgi:hypothetical protein